VAANPQAGSSRCRQETCLPEIVERLVARFNPLQIYLFGSVARGDARQGSDVDLLIVMPEETDRMRTEVAMRRSLSDRKSGHENPFPPVIRAAADRSTEN